MLEIVLAARALASPLLFFAIHAETAPGFFFVAGERTDVIK